jgi:hypothetical protein
MWEWVKNIPIFNKGTREVWDYGFKSWPLRPIHPLLCTRKLRGWWVSVPLWKLQDWGRAFLHLTEIKTHFLNNRSVTALQHSLSNGHVCYNVLLLQLRYVTNSNTYWAVRSASPNFPADTGQRRRADESFKLSLQGARISWLILGRRLVWHVAYRWQQTVVCNKYSSPWQRNRY